MTATIDEQLFIADAMPPTEDDTITCQYPGCGVELVYSGKGRKPSKCDEHRRLRGLSPKKAKTTAPAAGGNEKLAAQAADVLFQLNEMLGLGLMLAKLFGTTSALSDRNEAFRDQAYEALKVDPGLCRTIVSAGAKSGKLSLIAAYAMLAASVAPVAVDELRELRAAKAAAAAEAEREAAA